MGVASGKFGVVNGESTVFNWTLNESQTTHKVVASNTKGGPLRKAGIKDWSGSFSQSVIAPTNMPGDEFTFKGLTAPDTGVEGTAGPTHSGPAIVESLAITWDWETMAPIKTTVNFAGNGELTHGNEAIEDTETPDIPVADSDTYISYEAGSASDLCAVSQATLNITAENQTYVNSCTGGWTKRKKGPIDWNLSLTLQEADVTELPFEKGDIVELKAFVTDALYWHLKWGIVGDFSNINVDRESGAIIGFTVPIEMSSHDAAGVIGNVIPPGVVPTTWFPTP